MPAKFELIAPCFFRCESTAKFELNRIGAENIRVDDGRLTFSGGAEMIAAANLHLRRRRPCSLCRARSVRRGRDHEFSHGEIGSGQRLHRPES